MAFFVIALAAAEAAVGLAIVLAVFRHNRSLHVDEANALRH
jgi:NADH-quinone oxidoreductase subunit K